MTGHHVHDQDDHEIARFLPAELVERIDVWRIGLHEPVGRVTALCRLAAMALDRLEDEAAAARPHGAAPEELPSADRITEILR